MIQKIQNLFHTDKLWGRIIFITLIYILYWVTFYGSWFLIPRELFGYNTNLSGILFILYIFIVVPLISVFIPYFIKKIFYISKSLLYFLHIFLIILSIILFMTIGILISLSHFSIG